MIEQPQSISLDAWESRYQLLREGGLREPCYGGPLQRHVCDGDFRLRQLTFDNSAAALRLWNFLLTEEMRLRRARDEGKLLVGAMKDLGTVPILAYSLPNVVAFYPDGAWWIPCVMEMSDARPGHRRRPWHRTTLSARCAPCSARSSPASIFPRPDLLVCSVGATCDDFSAIAQRLDGIGFPSSGGKYRTGDIRKRDEPAVRLPGGFPAPQARWISYASSLPSCKQRFPLSPACNWTTSGWPPAFARPTSCARCWPSCARLAYTATPCPLPALEMLIAEMLALHFCSDLPECIARLTSICWRKYSGAWRRKSECSTKRRHAYSGSTPSPICAQ